MKIGIIGLGYVGLPLAVEFGKKFQTTGYDISSSRIKELKEGEDSTLEVRKKNLHQPNLRYTDKPDELKAEELETPVNELSVDSEKNSATFAAIQNQEDAPPCSMCGAIMVRSGSCYKCNNCGTTSGCA